MTRYTFKITNGEDFSDSEELSDDDAAWEQALRTVRDIESALRSAGGEWSLVVLRDGSPLYRIDVRAEKLDQVGGDDGDRWDRSRPVPPSREA